MNRWSEFASDGASLGRAFFVRAAFRTNQKSTRRPTAMTEERAKQTTPTKIGVKQVVAYGDAKIAISTFGKGAKAKLVYRDDWPTPYETGIFSVDSVGRRVEFSKGLFEEKEEASALNPVEVLLDSSREDFRKDYLLLKDVLEEEFFGKKFERDNVRIQIIHCVLDVLKIFGLYVNDIIYAINNLRDRPGEDIVGISLSDEKKAIEALKEMAPFFGYFGTAFGVAPKKPRGKFDAEAYQRQLRAVDSHNVGVLRILSAARHFTAHFSESRVLFSSCEKLKERFQEKRGRWEIIEENYKARIDKINDEFLEKSKTNLQILFEDVYRARTATEMVALARDYYLFAIKKDVKNLGVNATKLRELMLERFRPEIKDKKHDSYRSKLYRITDFVIFRHMRDSVQAAEMIEILKTVEPDNAKRLEGIKRKYAVTETLEATFDAICAASDPAERARLCAEYGRSELYEMVAKLRATPNDDEAKEELYRGFATQVWGEVSNLLLPVFDKYDGTFPVYSTEPLPNGLFDDVLIKSSGKPAEGGPLPFVQFVSFLCNFMEAKEINELVTALIHKFDAIQAFLDLMKELGDKAKFAPAYSLFNDLQGRAAGIVADQLRVLQSVGKMNGDLDSTRRPLFVAAIKTLGVPDDSQYVTDEWLDANMLDPKSPQAKTSKPFRNFLTNNVLKSKRFIYLTRYARPSTVRAVMANRRIVRYVLTRLPENQIDSYYKNFSDDDAKLSAKIDFLAKRLSTFSFLNLAEKREDVAKNAKLPEGEKLPEIQQLKSLTGLYLAVAYVLIKNLVKANARYFIGYAAFDRDAGLIRQQFGEELYDSFSAEYQVQGELGELETRKNDYLAPLNIYIERDKKLYFVPTEEQKSDPELFRAAFKKHSRSVRFHYAKRWRDILEFHLLEASEIDFAPRLFAATRNSVAHLSALANLEKYVGDFRSEKDSGPMRSYFELFHYVQQRYLAEKFDLSKFVRKTVASKDLIKLLYLPFAYSLPRFKNLTVDALFDPDGEDGKERAKRLAEGKKVEEE